MIVAVSPKLVQLAFSPMQPLLPARPYSVAAGVTGTSVSAYTSVIIKMVLLVHHAFAVTHAGHTAPTEKKPPLTTL